MAVHRAARALINVAPRSCGQDSLGRMNKQIAVDYPINFRFLCSSLFGFR
jgi:hypothetical protein